MPRLTADELARFRADYHECAATIVPLLDHIDALTAERDRLAAAVREALRRLSEASEMVVGLDGRTLDVGMVRGVLRHALDTLAADGGG